MLRLAVDHGVEAVAAAVESRLGQGERWRALDLAQRLSPPAAVRESPDELVPELGSYDALMRLETEAAHAG